MGGGDERREESEMGRWTRSDLGYEGGEQLIVGGESLSLSLSLWSERHSLFDLVPIRVFNVCAAHHNLWGLSWTCAGSWRGGTCASLSEWITRCKMWLWVRGAGMATPASPPPPHYTHTHTHTHLVFCCFFRLQPFFPFVPRWIFISFPVRPSKKEPRVRGEGDMKVGLALSSLEGGAYFLGEAFGFIILVWFWPYDCFKTDRKLCQATH